MTTTTDEHRAEVAAYIAYQQNAGPIAPRPYCFPTNKPEPTDD